MGKPAKLTIQQWGDSLAVRIPSEIAHAARFTVGQPVEVRIESGGVVVKPLDGRSLTLEQKLVLFDPATHGSEAMVCGPVGAETVKLS